MHAYAVWLIQEAEMLFGCRGSGHGDHDITQKTGWWLQSNTDRPVMAISRKGWCHCAVTSKEP